MAPSSEKAAYIAVGIIFLIVALPIAAVVLFCPSSLFVMQCVEDPRGGRFLILFEELHGPAFSSACSSGLALAPTRTEDPDDVRAHSVWSRRGRMLLMWGGADDIPVSWVDDQVTIRVPRRQLEESGVAPGVLRSTDGLRIVLGALD